MEFRYNSGFKQHREPSLCPSNDSKHESGGSFVRKWGYISQKSSNSAHYGTGNTIKEIGTINHQFCIDDKDDEWLRHFLWEVLTYWIFRK